MVFKTKRKRQKNTAMSNKLIIRQENPCLPNLDAHKLKIVAKINILFQERKSYA